MAGSIVVTGGQGRLARALASVGGARVRGLSRDDVDVADRAEIQEMLTRVRPEAVINAAVAGSVDGIETNPDAAFAVNAIAPGLLAEACAKSATPLIHISTDYVFGDSTGRAWREDDPVSPINAYGRMKVEGEHRVFAVSAQTCVARVAWLFGDGHDFIARLLRNAHSNSVIVADDQIGSPTPILPLAGRLLELADKMVAGEANVPPLLHLAGDPPVSRADWVATALEALEQAGRPQPRLIRASMDTFTSSAPRPRFSALDNCRATALFGAPLDWRTATSSPDTFLAPPEI